MYITDNGHQYQPTSDPLLILSLFIKYCWCAKDRINLLKGQHIGLVIDLWNFCLSNHPWQIYGFLFFVVTGLFWSTISAELFFFLRRWKCRRRRLGIEIILPWWLQQKEPKFLKKSQIIVTTSSKWQQLRQSWEDIFKSNKIQQPEDLGYPERYTIQ